MSPLILIIILILSIRANGQYKCKEHFLFVKNYFENNSASYKDNVPKDKLKQYIEYSDSILSEITLKCDTCDCISSIQKYLNFFRDNHISINVKEKVIDEKDSNQVNSFLKSEKYLNTENISITSNQLSEFASLPTKDIEGIYIENGNDYYTVAIIKTKGYNKYKAIITKSKTSLWSIGQVKFEFTVENDSTFKFIRYDKYHNPILGEGKIKNSNLLNLGYRKLGAIKYREPNYENYEFKELNSKTTYLKLKSFNGSLFNELDSFYLSKLELIKSRPFLIIDIRDNGGGSDACYERLKQLFYTNPIVSDIVDIYATPENIKRYESNLKMMLEDSLSFGSEAIIEQKRQISVMKKTTPFNYSVIQPKSKFKLKEILKSPQKIILIFNKGTASSAEDLIFDAMQSKKIITLGENSNGDTGYGNVCEIEIPNSDLVLSYTTLRYRLQIKYDGIGFEPKIKIKKGEEAIKKAIEILE